MSGQLTVIDPAGNTVRDWSAEQYQLMVWLASPRASRMPETLDELAASLFVNPSTLWRWRQLPGFREEVQKMARSTVGDRLADVLRSIEEMALAGSYQHQRLYLELVGADKGLTMGGGVKVLVGVRVEDV